MLTHSHLDRQVFQWTLEYLSIKVGNNKGHALSHIILDNNDIQVLNVLYFNVMLLKIKDVSS